MSANKIIAELDAEQMTKDIPAFAPGDTVVVQVKVKEGNRERLQAFEAVCGELSSHLMAWTALGMMIVSTIAVLIGPARMAKQMPC